MTPEEAAKRKKEWVTKMKQEGRMKENMTVDHKTTLNALQNPVRRKIVKALAEREIPRGNQSRIQAYRFPGKLQP